MNTSQTSVSSTLTNAVSAGIISSQSQQAIATELDDIAIAGCAGVDIDDIDSEEVTLVTVIIDASSSMTPFASDVLEQYREQFLEPLQRAKNAESLLVSVLVFSDDGGEKVRLIHGYTPIPDCKPLTSTDYNPSGMTPLRDAIMKGITGLVNYGQTLRDNGTRTKSIVLVLSDGWDNASRVSGAKVKRLSEDVLRAQEFVLSYIFFGDQSEGDDAAKKIGFPPHHRLTGNLDPAGIRRVFGAVSASVISTSQSVVSAASISSNPFFGQ